MYLYMILETLAWLLGGSAILFILFEIKFFKWFLNFESHWPKIVWFGFVVLVISGALFVRSRHPYPLNFAMPPMMQSKAPGGLAPSIPLPTALQFLKKTNDFEVVADIGGDPNAVPEPISRKTSKTVKLNLVAKEVLADVAEGIQFNYWTYNGQVPGPMLRVREGDNVELSLTNDASSLHHHNIDLHAVTGPGGGSAVTRVEPGETKTFRWKALSPGLYVYHCATANISTHNAHGQYGMILVEPKEGLPPVDKEFYVMQGEMYTQGGIGKKGLVLFDSQSLLDGNPTYVTFNGKIESGPRMNVETGDKVRIYVGNGGVNLISSFHVIGEIFDIVYPEAAMGENSAIFENVQTTAVLPGGASIVEFTADVPGDLILVDHALARMNKGAWAIMTVEGEDRLDIYQAIE